MDISISLCITVDFLSSLDAWQHVLNILLSALLQENKGSVMLHAEGLRVFITNKHRIYQAVLLQAATPNSLGSFRFHCLGISRVVSVAIRFMSSNHLSYSDELSFCFSSV